MAILAWLQEQNRTGTGREFLSAPAYVSSLGMDLIGVKSKKNTRTKYTSMSLTTESNSRLKTEKTVCIIYTSTCSVARVIRKNKTHGPPKPTHECSLSHKHKNQNPNNAHYPLNLTCLAPYICICIQLCIVFAQFTTHNWIWVF